MSVPPAPGMPEALVAPPALDVLETVPPALAIDPPPAVAVDPPVAPPAAPAPPAPLAEVDEAAPAPPDVADAVADAVVVQPSGT